MLFHGVFTEQCIFRLNVLQIQTPKKVLQIDHRLCTLFLSLVPQTGIFGGIQTHADRFLKFSWEIEIWNLSNNKLVCENAPDDVIGSEQRHNP